MQPHNFTNDTWSTEQTDEIQHHSIITLTTCTSHVFCLLLNRIIWITSYPKSITVWSSCRQPQHRLWYLHQSQLKIPACIFIMVKFTILRTPPNFHILSLRFIPFHLWSSTGIGISIRQCASVMALNQVFATNNCPYTITHHVMGLHKANGIHVH